MNAYYNEIDRYCCDWLQNLMDSGHITPGKIDDRSITEVSPDDVRGYDRCHFFAGIAGWELALQMSGYDGPVWTGSCPCQPFSAAGKGQASGDERHLWPEWFRLIRAVRPPVIFGEQVEAAIGWGWLDLVHSDMEQEGYTIRSSVLPACSVGAPTNRARLFFMAESAGEGRWRRSKVAEWRSKELRGSSKDVGAYTWPDGYGSESALAVSDILLPSYGVPNRVAKLRAAGNAIVPQVAAEFIKAAMK